MNRVKRQHIFERLRDTNPDPTTELTYQSEFELLISVILSAQATDISVNKATAGLFVEANTPQTLLQLGLDRLIFYIRHIGLFNIKARNIMKTCEQLITLHNGQVPRDRRALEALPGVGRKTANVILNTAFGEPTMAVDTHIFRLSNRTMLAPGKTVRQVEDKLVRFVPAEFMRNAHHWLILHGRYVCTARAPKCGTCVIENLCEYGSKRL